MRERVVVVVLEGNCSWHQSADMPTILSTARICALVYFNQHTMELVTYKKNPLPHGAGILNLYA